MATRFKALPLLTDESVYENWEREIEIWQTFKDLVPKKQGPSIFLTLQEKARAAALEIEIKEMIRILKSSLRNKIHFVWKMETSHLMLPMKVLKGIARRPKDMNMNVHITN